MWGIWEGFREALEWKGVENIPRLFAVEPFPRLERVLAGEDYRDIFPGNTLLRSIGGDTVTYQSLDAVKRTGGGAVAVSFFDVGKGLSFGLKSQYQIVYKGFGYTQIN
ncbi:hypothetical protein [Polycladomyces subterraneus]|uniref:Uncharacterized protein n=1 Tax=Polycladomyces subterraneus TaxID=1016997 RepID=A0ABT8IR09_9BACL|nr:hypothetical protein [Polycladomyces subterraneus]MDN4595207.1 hypothetical protein [Polycladomyces subterraneus]